MIHINRDNQGEGKEKGSKMYGFFSLYFHFFKMLQNFYFKIQKKSQLFFKKTVIPFKQISLQNE